MSYVRHLFDTRPGLIITAVFMIVIGSFIAIKPSPQPTSTTTPHPSPTPVVTTIQGKLNFKCSASCVKDFSAYDIAAYPNPTSTTPLAQGPIQNDGSFSLQLLTGSYYLKTIPASSVNQAVSVSTHTPLLNLTITP